jgi:hypothetical protein
MHMTHDQDQVAPRCYACGGPLVRAATGVLSLSATDRCPRCEQTA